VTKAELIRKIVKHSGIPDSEAKVFFERFLQKTSGILKPGQAAKLKNFGYFQLRQAIFKTTASKPSGKINQINTEVIVFFPFDESEEEGLIFNIPAVVTGEYNYIDSYFSLSIGKPVIPLQGVKDTDYFITPTGYEMKKLMESKVVKLLEDVEIIKDYANGNEVLFLEKTAFKEEHGESNWTISKLSREKLNAPGEQESASLPGETVEDVSYNNVSWDFGEDLSRQIEEEAIIDASSETAPSPVNDEQVKKNSLGWDFGEPFITGEIAEIEQKEVGDSAEILPENKINKNDFQRVKAITAEFKFDEPKPGITKSEDNLIWDFGEFEKKINYADKYENEAADEKPELSGDSEIENTIDTISGAEQDISRRNPSEKESEDITVLASGSKNYAPSKSAIDKTRTREYNYSRNKSFIPFFLAMFTIILVSATVFMYINKISLYDFSKGKFLKFSRKVSTQIIPAVIERNFDVPVTYPYPKNSMPKASGNDTDLGAASNNKSTIPGKPESNENNTGVVSVVPEKPGTPGMNIKTQPPANVIKTPAAKEASEKIKNNIFQRGKNYLVQVSSWRAKSYADQEAAKFRAKGYIPSIEQAEVPGRGIWFRVMIGNFKSVVEAEKFAGKNK
jgi:nucleoid DNA-binding protein/cell division septation protein DedD